MKRSGPPQRRTPLAQGTKGLARTPIAASPVRARTASAPRAQKTVRRTGASLDVRALVDARDAGQCVRCGGPASDRDHRQGRGAGGTHGELSNRINGAAWILTLCGQGNTSGCHGWKETHRDESERDGYRLPRNGIPRDAERVPVRTRAGWRLFADDGSILRCPTPPNDDAREATP